MYAKLCINDRCNMNCDYCFLDPKFQPELDVDTWVQILAKLKNLGVTEIDFFGREPLYDRKAFDILDKAIKQHITFSYVTMITNGKNIPKYITEISTRLDAITISMGDNKNFIDGCMEGLCNFTYIRSIVCQLALTCPVEISIDVSNRNISNIRGIIHLLEEAGVKSVYLKPIMAIGKNAKKALKHGVSEMDFENMCEELTNSSTIGIPVKIHIPFNAENLTLKYCGFRGNPNVTFIVEPYCTCDGESLYINSLGICYPCGYCDILKRDEVGFDFLGTPNSEIKKLITSDGRRFCGR